MLKLIRVLNKNEPKKIKFHVETIYGVLIEDYNWYRFVSLIEQIFVLVYMFK